MCFFFQAEDGIRDYDVTGVQTCALPIFDGSPSGDWSNNSFELYYTNVDGGCPSLSNLYDETCDANTGDFGECTDCSDENCLSKGDPTLPKNSDGTDTNIGYCDNFDWDWEEIWGVNYDHFTHLIWDIQFNKIGRASCRERV